MWKPHNSGVETDGTIVLFNTSATLGLFMSIKTFKSQRVDYVTGAGQQSVFTKPHFLMSRYRAGEGAVVTRAWDPCQKYGSCFRTLGLPQIESNPPGWFSRTPHLHHLSFIWEAFRSKGAQWSNEIMTKWSWKATPCFSETVQNKPENNADYAGDLLQRNRHNFTLFNIFEKATLNK